MKDKTKSFILNGILPVIDQILRLIVGLIVSKLVLTGFGSEYNGLINSTSNILQYLVLLEAGISTTTRIALFKAFANEDKEQISAIFSSARFYYRRISYLYLFIVFIIAFVYPVIVKSEIDYWIIFGVVTIQGASSALNFAFNTNLTQLYVSSGKSYITNLVTILVYLLCNVGKIIAVLIFDSIFVMLSFNLVITIIQSLIYYLIYKRNFSWIKVENVYDKKLLPDRGAYLIMQAGYLLFNATDTVVLSIFCGFKLASVYTVYMMVYLAIKQVATALRNNFQYVIGQGYTKCRSNTKEYLKVYDLYQNGINTVTTCMLAICYILVLPFITLYTSGVTDINYINTALPIFFTLNLLFDDWNYPGSLLMRIAGNAKQLSICECIIGVLNIILSVILVNYLEIVGVLIGTLVAVLIKNTYIALKVNKKYLNVSVFHDIFRNSGNIILLIICIIITNYLNLHITNYLEFFMWCCIITPCALIVFLVTNLIINYSLYKPWIVIISSKIKKNKE